ncbi:membrane protein DedA, SNARE-associated domain [Cellulomonas marina]|uniref:Membrane protein DedA, SNARE-associated domain n=1 Tax=Cellulomonas marina TaxID=988821 RepID=A0A1I0ZDG8_9CELL|nr:membrane protein DedA, SNARE-associated domain [Cellulomonas marina]
MPALTDAVTALAGTPWALLVLYVLTVVDGVLPPLPSEAAVLALAALAAGGPALDVLLVGGVAALGAFTGDQVAYTIGARLPVRRSRLLRSWLRRSPRLRRSLRRAGVALRQRGAAVVLPARFVPGARVAVALAAGATGMSRRRFCAITAVGAVAWATLMVSIGAGAGHLLDDRHPFLVVAAGVVGGLLVGAVLDRVLQAASRLAGRLAARRAGRRGASAGPRRGADGGRERLAQAAGAPDGLLDGATHRLLAADDAHVLARAGDGGVEQLAGQQR